MNIEDQVAQISDPQEFTRLCNSILTELHGDDFQVIDGTRSDEGNDGYIISEKRIIAMYCPMKPERQTDSKYMKKILSDLKKAKSLHESGKYDVENWTFMTPRKLSNTIISKMMSEATNMGINANHKESTFLANGLCRNKHLIHSFPFLHLPLIDIKLDEIAKMIKDTAIGQSPTSEQFNMHTGYTTDFVDKKSYDRVIEVRKKVFNEETKKELKTILYKTNDDEVKLNTILGLLESYFPLRDSLDDILSMCDLGIEITDRTNNLEIRSLILGYRGYILSFHYSNIDMELATQIKVSDFLIDESYIKKELDKLKSLEIEFDHLFDKALKIADENKFYNVMASILMLIGNAAGQRAIHLNHFNSSYAPTEISVCKRSLLSAKGIYNTLQDELGEAYALHNLANNIRNFGETEEALSLVKQVISIAEKHNEIRLIDKANTLYERITTGNVPNYFN